MSGRAWSLISIEDDRQYAGNAGYLDEPEQVYKYDSHVANHRQIARLDLGILRDHTHVIGIGLIQGISTAAGQKELARCPECGITGFKPRQNRLPRFRCYKGHEFDSPRVETVDVTLFEARYADTYVAAPNAFSLASLKSAALRPNDQLSIEEVDIRKLDAALLKGFPKTRPILESFYQGTDLDIGDALVDSATDAGPASEFTGSLSDTRSRILTAIRIRRGQARFRNSLIRRYSGKCLISGCRVVDVLEAAHIWPYRGEIDNSPDNGLLLRGDIHTLFDLNHIAIEPGTLTVHLSPILAESEEYARFHHVSLGVSSSCQPAQGPLQHRWSLFISKFGQLRDLKP